MVKVGKSEIFSRIEKNLSYGEIDTVARATSPTPILIFDRPVDCRGCEELGD
jgi:hypothetical protein